MNDLNDIKIIDLTPDNIAEYGVCGYKDVNKHLELRRKIEWYKEFYPKGLRISEGTIVTLEESDEIKRKQYKINVVPAWRWFLE